MAAKLGTVNTDIPDYVFKNEAFRERPVASTDWRLLIPLDGYDPGEHPGHKNQHPLHRKDTAISAVGAIPPWLPCTSGNMSAETGYLAFVRGQAQGPAPTTNVCNCRGNPPVVALSGRGHVR